MNHNTNIKVENFMNRFGLRADKIPAECQLENCHSRVTYLLIDYNDSKFYPRGVCEEHALEYRRAQWKREDQQRKEHKGKIQLPLNASCAICKKPQSVNDFNLVTCPEGHIGAQTIIVEKKKGPKPKDN